MTWTFFFFSVLPCRLFYQLHFLVLFQFVFQRLLWNCFSAKLVSVYCSLLTDQLVFKARALIHHYFTWNSPWLCDCPTCTWRFVEASLIKNETFRVECRQSMQCHWRHCVWFQQLRKLLPNDCQNLSFDPDGKAHASYECCFELVVLGEKSVNSYFCWHLSKSKYADLDVPGQCSKFTVWDFEKLFRKLLSNINTIHYVHSTNKSQTLLIL